MQSVSRGAGLLAAFALASLCSAQNADNSTNTARINDVGPAVAGVVPEALGTSIAGPYDVESGPFDNRCLGVEEAWGHYIVTGAGHTTTGWNYMLHEYDYTGNYLGSTAQVTASTGWAGRDMESDEVAGKLWVGSDNGEVSEYDWIAGALVHNQLITVNVSGTVRALCQNDTTGNFYTKSFTSTFYEFDLIGNQYAAIAAAAPSAYGFGWDWASGTIWSTDAGPSVMEMTTAAVGTGNTFGFAGAAQGGADVYEDVLRNPGFLSIIVLSQTSPDSIELFDLGVSVGGTPCTPPIVYCTAAQNASSGGCFATISTSSNVCPVSDANDYDVLVSGAEENKPGVVFYGYAPATIPFSSGQLCVAPPIRRTPPQNTGGGGGGTPGCYNDRNAFLTAAGTMTHTEDFSGFTVDTSFDPTTGGTGPVAIAVGTIEVPVPGGAAFRNFIDVPPFQYGDNNGTNNCSSFTNWDEPTEIHVIPSAAVGAYGCGISQGLGLEMVEMACLAGGSTQYVCTPGDNGIDSFTGVISATLLDQIVYRSQTYSPGGGGEGFGLDGLEMVVGPAVGGCGGSMILRINDPMGNVIMGTGLSPQPGDIVFFQGWMRDPASGFGTDVSDAVEVTYK